MKREGLTLSQARRIARQMAKETEQHCLIYQEKGGSGLLGVVPQDEADGDHVKRAIQCVWPMEA